MAGEKLAEVAQEGKDVSGSNIYLGRELAKADVKFGTWSLETGQPAAQPGGTKNEEEKLKQVDDFRDGATIAGRAGTPSLGFSLLGPKETPPTSGVPVASHEVPSLGDLPTLGKAFKGAETKSEQARGEAASLTDWDLNVADSTNLLANNFFYVRRTGGQTNWVRNFTVDGDGYSGKPAQNSQNTDTLTVSGGLPTQQGPSNVYSLDVAGYHNVQNPSSNYFSNRLKQSSGSVSYDRYDHYRLLEQLGTETNQETKLALNYSNVSDEDVKKPANLRLPKHPTKFFHRGRLIFAARISLKHSNCIVS